MTKFNLKNKFSFLKRSKVASTGLTPEQTAKLDSIAQAHEARLAAEAMDVKDIAANFSELIGAASTGLKGGNQTGFGTLPGQAKPGYSMPHEDLLGGIPKNTDSAAPANASPSEQGAARDDANALRPSGNPTSWVGGAASNADVSKDTTTGTVTKTWTITNEGSTTERTSSYNPQSGDQTSTSTTRGQDGQATAYVRITDAQDGSSDGTTRVNGDNGTQYTHTWNRNATGQFTHDYFETTDRNGRVTDRWNRLNDPQGRDRLVRMPRDDAPTEAGARFGARFSHGAKAQPPEINKVNPGDPDDSGPSGARINPGENIVTNPSAEAASPAARQVSAAQAKHWQDQLKEKAGGHVNPEDGGTGGR